MVVLVLCFKKSLLWEFFLETLNEKNCKKRGCLSLQRPGNFLNSFNFSDVVGYMLLSMTL